MKKFLAAALALSAIACQQKEDTTAARLWPRTFQPRLSIATEWQPCRPRELTGDRVVQDFSCNAPHNEPVEVSPLGEACDDMNETTHRQALEELSSKSPCYSKAIRNLERLAKQDKGVLSDLAAAYYVRAQRTDNASDLLPAMKFAQEAVNHAPRSSVARFNLALVQEALSFDDDAVESWDRVRAANEGPWSTEAGEHREALERKITTSALVQWPRTKAQLSTVNPNDRAAVAGLVAPHPFAAQKYVEEELLPAWDLPRARAIAEALWKRNGDRYMLDVVEAADKSGGALREAHENFGEARAAQRAFIRPVMVEKYREAFARLQAAGSPLSIGAQIGIALGLAFEKKSSEARALALQIEHAAAERSYKQLVGHARSTRAYIDSDRDPLTGLSVYAETRAWFAALRDDAAVAEAYRGRAGLLRASGNTAQAWRETFLARRYSVHSTELQSVHHLLGESAAAADEMGYPAVALRYLQRVVMSIREALAATPPDQTSRILNLRRNLSTALRTIAMFEARLDQLEAAMRDINESLRLARANEADDSSRNAFIARAEEVNGRVALARGDARAAIAAFSKAIAVGTEEYTTFVAGLYAQRAEAYRHAANPSAAEADLKAALKQLHSEEARMLDTRKPGTGEPLLSAYFSRFQETYDRLIRHYTETNRNQEAFELAERARAIEPLDLILRQTRIIPREFAELARRPVKLEKIQQTLPANTYLVQYNIQDEKTYVWMIGRDEFKSLALDIGSKDVEGWAEQLYREAREPVKYDRLAATVYQQLVQQALALVPLTANRRVVFIPDGAMHGIPIAALRNGSQYLIETERLAFAGSARLYIWSVELDRAMKNGGPPSILLIGNPTGDLDAAVVEVREISRFYTVFKMLLNEQATTAAFLQDAPEYSVVHIAAHAVANAETPSQSHLSLAGKPLEAQELVTKFKSSKTRLFVLSACSSAGGTPVGPEGLAPLVRPLIAAGVPAVVGSLWPVNDPAAKAVTVRLHRHWSEGDDAADALRRAQIDLIHGTAGARSVLTWGSFQVIGHATSPFASPPKSIKEK